MTRKVSMITSAGAPHADDQSSRTAGRRGLLLIQN